MRFLKTKIRLSWEALQKKRLTLYKLDSSYSLLSVENSDRNTNDTTYCSGKEESNADSQSSIISFKNQLLKLQELPKSFPQVAEPKSCSDTKNIPINYGRAIMNFANSSLAEPYIKARLENNENL